MEQFLQVVLQGCARKEEFVADFEVTEGAEKLKRLEL